MLDPLALLGRNAPIQGIRGKLATARLTLMILFPMPGMAIFLVPVRSACGARVSDDNGCWWPPYVWDCFCSTVARNRVASITCVALPAFEEAKNLDEDVVKRHDRSSNASSNAFASWRSAVSKPSVNQP